MRRLIAALALPAAASLPAVAAPLPPDPTPVWTLQDENATLSTAKVTDRYYVNGLRLSYNSGTDAMPGLLNDLASKLWGDGQRRWSAELSQQIYTPFDTVSRIPPKGDRPYAGVLMGTLGVVSDTEAHRSSFTMGIGVMGPGAMGKEVQNGFHDLIGQRGNNGWGAQLKDEPLVQFTSARVYRVKLGNLGPLETDVLPELSAGLGNLRTYIESGLTVRLGQGLDADFGTPRVRPGPSGGDVFKRLRDLSWYVFAGVDGQFVLREATLDGNLFRKSLHVKRDPLVGEAFGGLAVMIYGARLAYTHVVQTEQFKGQKGGLHQFGSISLSVRF